MMSKTTEESDPVHIVYCQLFDRTGAEVLASTLRTENIFHRRKPPAEDECFDQQVAVIQQLCEEGEISASEAARMIGLSLREFVELFVVDEEWLASLGDAEGLEKEALLNEVTDALRREEHGITAREFVEEYVLDEDFLSLPGVAGKPAREVIRHALDALPTDLLGNLLRMELSVGASLPEFVEVRLLNEEWFGKLGINDAQARHALVEKAVGALSGLNEYNFNSQWFTAFAVRDREIPDCFVRQLGEAIASRQIKLVTELLAKWDYRTVLLSPNEKNAALLLSYYAQWIDFDASYLPRVEELLAQFRRLPRNKLCSMLESAHVDTAEGLVRLHHERYDEAIMYFTRALRAADEEGDADLRAVSRYYLARCFWKKANYTEARKYAEEAREFDGGLARQKRVAAIKMVEGWLWFLEGDIRQAKRLLTEAEEQLKDTEPINHGNILSFYGRLALKEERYDEALNHFWGAILAYQAGDPKHRNVARTHTNIATVYYLQASRLPAAPESRPELLRLRLKAFEHLDAAKHIYNFDPERNSRGLGKVHGIRALLYDKAREKDRARAEAEMAFMLGEAKEDHIVMGRAKRILSKVTLDPLESLALSAETLLHAERTENRTLLARAYINMGSSLLKMSEVEEGEKYLDEARSHLTPEERKQPYWREAFRRAEEGRATPLIVEGVAR